jgi:hypothetical protein
LAPFLPLAAAPPPVFAVLEARVVGAASDSAARFLPIKLNEKNVSQTIDTEHTGHCILQGML